MEKRQGSNNLFWINGDHVCSGFGTNLEKLIMDIFKAAVTAWNMLMIIICVMIAIGYIRVSDIRGIIATVEMVAMQVLTLIVIWRR